MKVSYFEKLCDEENALCISAYTTELYRAQIELAERKILREKIKEHIHPTILAPYQLHESDRLD